MLSICLWHQHFDINSLNTYANKHNNGRMQHYNIYKINRYWNKPFSTLLELMMTEQCNMRPTWLMLPKLQHQLTLIPSTGGFTCWSELLAASAVTITPIMQQSYNVYINEFDKLFSIHIPNQFSM